jgi:hypothetical protein
MIDSSSFSLTARQASYPDVLTVHCILQEYMSALYLAICVVEVRDACQVVAKFRGLILTASSYLLN